MALTELARFLPRHDHRNRYLRGGVRARDPDHHDGPGCDALLPGAGFELPPGGTFEPDSQLGLQIDAGEDKHVR